MRLTQLCIFLFAITLLQSCYWDTPGVWKDNQIDKSQLEDFHAMNDQAMKYIKANDVEHLGFLLSKDILDNSEESRNRLVRIISNTLNQNDYTLLDEYYAVNKYRTNDTVKGSSAGIGKYNLIYPGDVRKTYIALFSTKPGPNRTVIMLMYNKYSYGWKISRMDAGDYTING